MKNLYGKEDFNPAPIPMNSLAQRGILVLAVLILVNLLSCTGGNRLLSERLVSTNDRTKRSAFSEMNKLDIPSREKYLAIMKEMLRDKKPDNRVLAADSLGRMGPAAGEAVPDLIRVLNDEEASVHLRAVSALAEIGTAAVPALIAALNHQDTTIRCGAVDALGVMGPGAKGAVPALVILLSDQDYPLSRHSASALGLIGPAAVPALTQVAKSGNGRTIDTALTAFSVLKAEPGIVHKLVQLMADTNESPSVRSFSAKALGKMQEKAQEAMPELAHALDDDHNEVRIAAGWALVQMGPAAIPTLKDSLASTSPRERSGAANALGCMGPAADDAVPLLLQSTRDENPVVRVEAISAVEKIQTTSRSAVKALIRVLEEDPDGFVRLGAARALNKIGTYDAKDALDRYNKKNGRD